MSAQLDPVFYTLTDLDRLYASICRSLSKDLLIKIYALNEEDFREWCKITERGILKYFLWEYRQWQKSMN